MRSDGRPWHGGRVLVCDDNLLMADVVGELLRECGLEPVGPVGRLEAPCKWPANAHSTAQSWTSISTVGPRFPVCAILSARHIPFIFLTGYPDAAMPIEYRGALLVAKPFEPNEMKEVLAHILGLPSGWPLPQHLRSSATH